MHAILRRANVDEQALQPDRLPRRLGPRQPLARFGRAGPSCRICQLVAGAPQWADHRPGPPGQLRERTAGLAGPAALRGVPAAGRRVAPGGGGPGARAAGRVHALAGRAAPGPAAALARPSARAATRPLRREPVSRRGRRGGRRLRRPPLPLLPQAQRLHRGRIRPPAPRGVCLSPARHVGAAAGRSRSGRRFRRSEPLHEDLQAPHGHDARGLPAPALPAQARVPKIDRPRTRRAPPLAAKISSRRPPVRGPSLRREGDSP